MERLRASDLRVALDVTSTIVGFETLHEYRDGVLGELRRLVRGDVYGYNEVEPGGRPAFTVLDPPDAAPPHADEIFARLAMQNPVVARHAGGDRRTLKWSDFVSRGQLHRTDVYDLVYRPQGAEAQIACALPGGPSRVLGLAVNRLRGDFSERDRAMVDLARPAFVQAYRAAIDRAMLEALLAAPGSQSRGVILLTPHLTVERATPAAERWLELEPDRDAPDRIPSRIADWVEGHRRARSRGRIRVGGDGVMLRFVPAATGSPDTLVVEWPEPRLGPEAREALGLTSRELEVLQLVERGRTNAQIALELGVKQDTVAKHLHHVFDKLGVANRTEAVHRAAELARAG